MVFVLVLKSQCFGWNIILKSHKFTVQIILKSHINHAII